MQYNEFKKDTRWTTPHKLCNQPAQFQEEMTTGSLSLDIYRDHLRVRQILITKDITEESVETIALQIMRFNEEDDEREQYEVGFNRMNNPITLKIASRGGEAGACLAIVSQIIQSATPVIGVAVGDCSSAASIILLSCHARFASRYSRIMIHSMITSYMDSLQGAVEQIEESLKIQQLIDDLIVTKTRISQKKLDEIKEKRKDWYFNSFEAKELGVIDEVLEIGIPTVPVKERKKPAKVKPAK